MSDAYKKAGVDIDSGNAFIDRIKGYVKETRQRGVISDLGGFGALFAPDISDMKEPILVSGTDGVGTKLKIAIDMEKLDTIGIDLVAMCVNDIACSGAKPLFFLDYFATSHLEPAKHADVIKGIAEGCKLARCALVGGETAEMPDFYKPNDFDIAGFAVGIVDRAKIIDGSEIGTGNAIIGIASSGPHSNGYSLINHVIKNKNLKLDHVYEGFDAPLGEILLRPTFIYTQLIEALAKVGSVKGIVHITGGGFWDNIPRILPRGVEASIDRSAIDIPQIFRFIQSHAGMDDDELLRVFNCGTGMVMFTSEENSNETVDFINAHGFNAKIIGNTKLRQDEKTSISIS